MRGSTALEERLGRANYIALLNQFFETASDCVVAHQGEVLKFIGDAVLAVFPADDDGVVARANALQAARDIVTRLDQFVEVANSFNGSLRPIKGRGHGGVQTQRAIFRLIGSWVRAC